MISFRPITSRIAARAFGDWSSTAERTVDLSRQTRSKVDLPISLPGETDRIKGHHAFSDPQLNRERLTSRIVEQGPTRMHLLRDVIVADGCIMSRRCFQRMGQVRRRFLVCGDPEEIDEAALCSTYFTEKYFGHWLREGIAMEQLALDQGLPPAVLYHAPWLHEPSYRSMVSMHPRIMSLARCDRLWLLEDPRYNSHFAERYQRVRETLRKNIGARARRNARVFISRGQNNRGRLLANEDEVRDALVARGFMLLDPEHTDARTIARALSVARLVVAPEGSALAHAAIAMPRGAGLLTIMGPQHFNMNYKGISDVLGFSFGFTIADAVDSDRFSQPIDRLLRTIDLMEGAAENRVMAA